MVNLAIGAGVLATVASLVLAFVVVRKMGGLRLGNPVSEHPMSINEPLTVAVPDVAGRLVVGLRLGYTYQRYTTGTMPDADIEVSAQSLGTTLYSGRHIRTGTDFGLHERWSGDDAWRCSTRKVVELPPLPAGCSLHVTVHSDRAEQFTEAALVLAEQR